ncbi:DUF6475 domain-containing protein [Limnobacter litoralis]|uniref:DUF6475 domain-containing protein n=1 Tax=Limnobacter litoralis TaxID=481366 RepID=A0ABQ5YPN6_9BURK|nr:DUF6475 domain-containing protein [Limnobacter litoralis]GLR26528.1 hypothetical protein GCM10007875_16180 [Limnobacter litoralis]
MKPTDFEAFSAMLCAVSEMYGKTVSEFANSLYWNALQNYELNSVRQAFDRHVKNPDTGQWMPKPADLIRMMQGSTQDSSMLAWSKVDKAVRVVGPYQTVTFDDPVIHRVISDMGGWVDICSKTDAEWPFVQREFENRYKGYATRGEIPEHLPSLAGIADAENLKQGHQMQPVTLIGNRRRAESNYRSGSHEAGLLQISTLLPETIQRITNNQGDRREAC